MITPAVKAQRLKVVAELAGHPNEVIAGRLQVSDRTVTRYRKLLGLRAWDSRDESYYSHGVAGYKRGCRCDKCATAHGEAYRRFRRDRLDAGLTPDDPRHGTVTGYLNWGCRCELCRAAGSRNNREAKERRAAKAAKS